MKQEFFYTKKNRLDGTLEVRRWDYPLAGWSACCWSLSLERETGGTARLSACCVGIKWIPPHHTKGGVHDHGAVLLSKEEAQKIPIGQSADRLFKYLTTVAREKGLAICWE